MSLLRSLCGCLGLLLFNVTLARDFSELFAAGEFNAIMQQGTQQLAQATSPAEKLQLSQTIAEAAQQLGDYDTALHSLQTAQTYLNTPETSASFYSQLGEILLALQQVEKAEQALQQANHLAEPLNNPALHALILNNLGNLSAQRADFVPAINFYQRAKTAAVQAAQAELELKILLNHLQVLQRQTAPALPPELLKQAFLRWQSLPDQYTKTALGLDLVDIFMNLSSATHDPEALPHSFTILQHSHAAGDAPQQIALRSEILAYQAQLYARQQRVPEAIQLTRQAIFLTQTDAAYSHLLYRWQWQLGQYLRQQGKIGAALQTYQQAVQTLQPIRGRLLNGTFERRIEPVYSEFADLLLQQARTIPEQAQSLRHQAQAVLELLKTAQLQDYFQSDCVSQQHITDVAQVLDPQTAVLYPILLAERLELLISFHDGIEQVTLPVRREQLQAVATQFRENLTIRTHRKYLEQAQTLYEWLISPLDARLQQHQIKTLVVVPDGVLRMIPLAALHDKSHFLIEKYALVTTPSLSLTDPRSLQREQTHVLITGLSEKVQGFSALPNVAQELETIQQIYNGALLENQDFSLGNVEQALLNTPYNIVHIASHGQFNRNPNNTFLLTYDGKLTMNRLEKLMRFSELRQEPVELLTLSACETAMGDERAALGLAGVAIQAGARSALASLWAVNDTTTATLISEFYQQLTQPNTSKAQALQRAQQKLLSQRSSQHPLYWAAFLLIGNWL